MNPRHSVVSGAADIVTLLAGIIPIDYWQLLKAGEDSKVKISPVSNVDVGYQILSSGDF